MIKFKKAVTCLACLMLCFSTLTVNANATNDTKATETLSTEASEYISVSNGVVTVEKDGYYSWCVNEGDKGFISGKPWMTVTSSGEANYFSSATASSWVKYSNGDKISNLSVASDCETNIYFSSTGSGSEEKTFNLILKAFSEPIEVIDESGIYPILKVSIDSSNEKEVNYTISASISDSAKNRGATLKSFQILNENEDEISSSAEYWGDDVQNAEFSIKLTKNGVFYLRVTDVFDAWSQQKVEVTSIEDIIPEGEENTDNEAPKVTYTGIPKSASNGEELTISIKTNEVCTIVADGEPFIEVKKASFNVYGNGTYTVIATDEAGNTTTETIEVTCFSDSSNPYNPDGRDNYWGDTVTDNLPQTGSTPWYIVVTISGLVLLLGVVLIIVRLKVRKKGEISNEE